MSEPPPPAPQPQAISTEVPRTTGPGESRGERLRRHGRRTRLYSWAVLAVVALIVIVALVVSNTRQVKVSWVVGSSHASLVWLVVAPAIVGWLGGIATAVLFRRRTRPPQR
jgi:uncharacterized integral membrane protein